MYPVWEPVNDWDMNGCKIRYVKEPLTTGLDVDWPALQRKLETFGRGINGHVYFKGFSPLPHFDGVHWSGKYTGETSVIDAASEMLKSDIEHLFHGLPHSENLRK
jgi:hypothetical protein